MSVALAMPSEAKSAYAAPLSSLEIWAASKIIGRDCAAINKAFLECKKSHDFPSDCEHLRNEVSSCVENIVKLSNQKFSHEFEKYQRCLDRNDWRHADCRKEQRAFLDQWNQFKGTQA